MQWPIYHINRHVVSIILLTFLQLLHSKIPSPGKLVNKRHNDVMTYKLIQLGHDVQN